MNYLGLDIGVSMLSEYDADGFLGMQVDAYGEQKAGVTTYEAHGVNGVISRPLDPDVDGNGEPVPGGGSQVLYALEGGRGHVIPLGDPRVLAKLPTIQKGEAFLYGAPGNFVRCHADGRISMYTTDDGTPAGHTISRVVDPNPLQGIVDFCPWGKATLNATGFHVLTASGARLDLGGIAAAGVGGNSYAELRAAAVNLTASTVVLGADAAGASPIAMAQPLIAILAALDVLLAATAAAATSSITLPVFAPLFATALATYEAATLPFKLVISSSTVAAT